MEERVFENIKNRYILKIIFDHLKESKLLQIVKYNKNIQKRLDIDLNDYKTFKKIILEIIPIQKKDLDIFIKYKKEEEKYYHIYFNDEIKEKKRNFFYYYEKISKIKIIIDEQIKSLSNLFSCECIEKIIFKKFNRKDITSMNNFFNGCISLKEIDLHIIDTNNVTSMYSLFGGVTH